MMILQFMLMTVDFLENLKPNSIFRAGLLIEGMACATDQLLENNNLKTARWVAIRGGTSDWAIYFADANKSFQWISDHGYEVWDDEVIRMLVPCTDEAFERYRF